MDETVEISFVVFYNCFDAGPRNLIYFCAIEKKNLYQHQKKLISPKEENLFNQL